MQRVVAEPEAIARLSASIKESSVGEVRVPVRIANPFDSERFWEADFLVDTGSTMGSVPVDVLNEIGVDAVEIVRVYMADGSSALRRVGLVRLSVAGVTLPTQVIYAPEDTEPLLGYLILEAMGFIVDPLRQRLLPRSELRTGHNSTYNGQR